MTKVVPQAVVIELEAETCDMTLNSWQKVLGRRNSVGLLVLADTGCWPFILTAGHLY